MLCQIRIEKKKKYLFSPIDHFFVKSRLLTNNKLSFYSNTKRKGQYTGWVERVVI